MTINREAYKEIQDVVGPENISEDPAVLDSYACHATIVGVPAQGFYRSIWWPRAGAVVLPGSTEEVQQIVKICNRYGIRFKAHSTGQVPWAFPMGKETLNMDLRRMDRIIEINEEHMYALIEPYVTQAQLLIETIKKGLAPHLIDGGCSISPLASVTSVHGEGDSGITRSFNERNGMAVEWVLPTGELIRLGTPDTPNAGWFSGDGPGPSLFGLMRGNLGRFGDMGVFTKAAIKLYPWHGPKELDSGGEPPWFDLRDWPLSDFIVIKWDDYRNEAEGLHLIGEAEIFESLGRLSTTKMDAVMAEDKNEWALLRRLRYFDKIFPKGGWFGLIVARTQQHFDYCHEALEEIAAQTNGEIARPEEIPAPEGIKNPELWGWRLKNAGLQLMILRNFTLKACEMPSAGTIGPLPAMTASSIDKTFEIIERVQIPIKRKYQREGKILDDGPDGCWCTIDEEGHWMKQMNFTRVEPMDPNATAQGLLESVAKAYKLGLQISDSWPNPDYMETLAPYECKLQDMVDPKLLSSGLLSNINRLLYVDEEEE